MTRRNNFLFYLYVCIQIDFVVKWSTVMYCFGSHTDLIGTNKL